MTTTSPAIKNIKFLLVDDLDANLQALEALLRHDGLELFLAHSGAQALELMLVHDFALALLDVQMPGMDGFELAQLMRGIERTRHVPIIFVTAGSTDLARRFQGYEAGAVDFLFKPVEPHILRSKAKVFFDLAQERLKLRESERHLRETNAELTQLVHELQSARQAAVRGMEEAVEARQLAEQLKVAAESATRAKDEFLKSLSHELRTPLNPAMLLATALSLDPGLAPAVRKDVESIVSGIAMQMVLVDDLLDLTRITGGKLRVDFSSVDAHEALNQAVDQLKRDVEGNRIQVEFDLAATRRHVRADPLRLQQVLWNILKNAVKFSPPGAEVQLRTMDSGYQRDQQNFLAMEISDSGVGIGPEMLDRVFEPFVQESHEGSNRFGGLGLGLAITRRLVELQDGRVSAKSDGRGKGSTFRIELPLAEPVPKAKIPGEAPSGHRIPHPARRILLVEDHDETRVTLKRLLELRGHTVFAAASAAEARVLAAASECDFVISDIGLPDEDGYSLMAVIREQYGLTGIALSGYGMVEDIQRSADSGFFKHLVKPVRFQDLEMALAAAPPPPS